MFALAVCACGVVMPCALPFGSGPCAGEATGIFRDDDDDDKLSASGEIAGRECELAVPGATATGGDTGTAGMPGVDLRPTREYAVSDDARCVFGAPGADGGGSGTATEVPAGCVPLTRAACDGSGGGPAFVAAPALPAARFAAPFASALFGVLLPASRPSAFDRVIASSSSDGEPRIIRCSLPVPGARGAPGARRHQDKPISRVARAKG
jgi:hypothetical protein